MKKRYPLLLILVAFMISALSGPSYALSYYTDFESGVGSEWSGSTPNDGNTIFTKFLGRLGNQTATLSLDGFGSGTRDITLTFDFYAIDSWDGENPTHGWDYFKISGDYNNSWTVDSTEFGNDFTFPYIVSESGQFGFSSWTDDIYRDISITFSHTGDNLTLSFFGFGLQSIGDESWGLDNVKVEAENPIPEPTTMLLVGSGLIGIACKRRKLEK